MTTKRYAVSLVLMLMITSLAQAQEVPAGTVLPVMCNTTLDSAVSKSGQKLTAKLMQSVPISSGEVIPAGARIEGEVVFAEQPSAGRSARIVVKFTRLLSAERQFDILAEVRAVASMQDVFEAQLPVGTFDDYGTSPSDWTTVQIGGAAVYHGDGTIRRAMEIVGRTTELGEAVGALQPDVARGCPGTPSYQRGEQALWLFSPWACGVYGLPDVAIVRQPAAGQGATIEFTSPRRIRIRAGSGWLLQVIRSTARK